MAVRFSPTQHKMEPPSFLPSPSISVFIALSLFRTLIPSSADNYTICSSPLKCGNTSFTYPFWGEGRPNFCGYPGFELLCKRGQPEIEIMQTRYIVKEIDPSRRAITVMARSWNTCPFDIANTNLNTTIFDYAFEVIHLKLYSSCRSTDLLEFQPEFNCSGGRNTIGFIATNSLQEKIGNSSCDHKVLVPVNQVDEEELEKNSSMLISAIRAGFNLTWQAENDRCDKCLASGGHCGFSSGGFNCYSRDGGTSSSSSSSSSRSSSNQKSVVAGIALGSAVFAGVVLIGFVVVFRIRRKREVISTDSSSSMDFRYDASKKSDYFGLQMFSYPELEEATNSFDPSRELGEGGFGVVYYGKLRDDRAVAVKRLYERNLKSVEQFMNEVQILARLRHPNLVTLFGYTSRRCRELLLVYEYVSNGTVADHLHGCRSSSGFLHWNLRLNIALETASALAYLHESDVIHRDVKTNNILLDDRFRVKVADFGLCRLFPIDVTHVSTAPQGTPGYVDPEYYNCYRLTDKSDVYSFGVVLMELVSSKEAVDITRHRHEINLANLAMAKIQNRLLHELVDPQLGFRNDDDLRKEITLVSELAFRCLQQERDVRPSMDEVVDILRGIAGSGSTRGTGNAKVEDDCLGQNGTQLLDIRGFGSQMG